MKNITSLQNPLVKHFLKLRKDKKYRKECNSVLIEGKKLVNELCATAKPKTVFLVDPVLLSEKYKSEHCFQITEEVLKKITGVQSPEGIIAEVEIPPEGNFEKIHYLLALDGVSDPGNLGTLLRTALALGWEGAFILDNCCDPYNDKALRSAKGATFRLPLQFGNWDRLSKIVRKNQMRLIAADMDGEDVSTLKEQENTLLVLGSEANGLSEDTRKRCEKVTIPMSGKMESLNVSIAGTILMYLVKPKTNG